MNAILEFWTPWQALQRSLADGFGVEAQGDPVPGSKPYKSGVAVPAAGSSWLVRARGSLPPAPAHRSGR